MNIVRIVIFLLCMSIFPATGGEIHSAMPAPGVDLSAQDRRNSIPKTGSRLSRVSAEYRKHITTRSANSFIPSDQFLLFSQNRVLIDAKAVDDGAALLGDLRKLGLHNGNRYGKSVSGLLPVAQLRQAATLASLRSMHATQQPIRNAGTITSQGDVALRADIARSVHAVDGSGVTVGVMSDSYDKLNQTIDAAADIASGDLPAAGVTVINGESAYCGVLLFCVDEGRAMLQIVHDIAPGAELLFHTALATTVDFANGIAALDAAGADVIVDDLLYLNEPMFEDGIVAQTVDAANANGVAYYSAAGNQGRQSYEAAFNYSGVPLCIEFLEPFDDCNPLFELVGIMHDFDPGPGQKLFQSVTIPVNGVLTIALQWDESFGNAKVDHEIVLLNETGDIWYEFGANDNVGTGEGWEVLQFFNSAFLALGTSFSIAITYDDVQSINPPTTSFKAVFFGTGISINDFPTNSSTVTGHANAAGATAVGAAFYEDTPAFGTSPPLLEPYSAAGGTPILFASDGSPLPLPLMRLKPELTAVDGVNTTFFFSDSHGEDGIDDFFGTSAAAPHAAGVAALLLESDPTATPEQLQGAMGSIALEMAGAGFDFDSGYGLIQADAAVDALSAVLNTAPVASFDVNPVTASLNVNFTDTSIDTDGTLSVWNWDFGGDGISTAQSPTHSFSAAGIYHIVLTVTDDQGSRNAYLKTIRVSASTVDRLLTVVINGDGIVESNPEGIDCGSDCSELYAQGEAVTLTTSSGIAWITVSPVWSNACSNAGSSPFCQVNMNADKQAEVTFSCDLMTIPQPDTAINTTASWQCANIRTTTDFEIAAGGVVSFEASTSIALGTGFRVGDLAIFSAVVVP